MRRCLEGQARRLSAAAHRARGGAAPDRVRLTPPLDRAAYDFARKRERYHRLRRQVAARAASAAALSVAAGEQEFYQQKGLLHEPQAFADCRKKQRQSARAARAANMHDRHLQQLRQARQVPFDPATDRPVFARSASRPPQRPTPTAAQPA